MTDDTTDDLDLTYDKLGAMDLDELRKVARFHLAGEEDVDLEKIDKSNKKTILNLLKSKEIDDEFHEFSYNADEDEQDDDDETEEEPGLPLQEPDEGPKKAGISKDKIIVVRDVGGRYDVLGYTFTKDNPYQLVPADAGEIMITKHPGFRQALPSEVEDFYN